VAAPGKNEMMPGAATPEQVRLTEWLGMNEKSKPGKVLHFATDRE